MLRLTDVTVRYGSSTALAGIDLELGPAERLAVLGPSGSGKSTLLRAIAGLEPLAGGRIEWAGQDLTGVPPHRRGFGLMFQDYALFPHRDVAGNIAFGLEMSGITGAARQVRVHEVLELVGLRGYERRRPDQLSGGEQQRVALARALAPTPRLLMLDEPLGALDRALRSRLLDDLAALFRELRLPILYVTHDQEEALTLGDRVAVLNGGHLETVLPAPVLWREPPNEFVARFLGFRNVAEASISGGVAATPWGPVALPGAADGEVVLVLRPEALSLGEAGQIKATVSGLHFRGDHARVMVRTAPHGADLELEVRDATVPGLGEEVAVAVDPRRVNVLPSASRALAPRT
jgi:thiamine transport system ATP-binding protein